MAYQYLSTIVPPQDVVQYGLQRFSMVYSYSKLDFSVPLAIHYYLYIKELRCVGLGRVAVFLLIM